MALVRPKDMSDKDWEIYQARVAAKNAPSAKIITDTGARDSAGNLLEGQSNQSAGVVAAKENRDKISAGLLTRSQQVAAREKAMGDALKSSKTINNYTFQDTPNLKAQLELNTKYDLPELTGLTGTPLKSQGVGVEGVEIPKEQARDFSRELAMAKKIGIDLRTMTDEQEKKLFMATYSPQELQQKGLSEFVNANTWVKQGTSSVTQGTSQGGQQGVSSNVPMPYDPTALKAMGLSDEQIKALASAGGAANAAAASLGATPKPTQSSMGILQEALNAKNNVTNQALGKSKLFEQAGLSGYESLAQSMNMRSQEMTDRYNSFRTTVADTATGMTDVYNAALDGYKTAMDEYNKQVEVMSKINEAVLEHQQALELLDKKASLDKETYLWEKSIEAKYAEPENPWKYQAGTENQPAGWVNSATQEFKPLDYSGKGSEVPVGDSIVSKNAIWDILGLDTNGQCGTKASTISTATKVGDTWDEKKKRIDKINNPKLGDKILIPLGVKNGKDDPGHVMVYLSGNAETGDMVVAEWNRHLDGKGQISHYNINELNKKYGEGNWGFASGDLKGNIKKALNNSSGLLGMIVKRAYQGAEYGVEQVGTPGGAIIGGMVGATAGTGEALGNFDKEATANFEKLSPRDKYIAITKQPPTAAFSKELDKMDKTQLDNYFDQLRTLTNTDEGTLLSKAKEMEAQGTDPAEIAAFFSRSVGDTNATVLMKKLGYEEQE